MKRHAGERREWHAPDGAHALSGVFVVRGGDFHRVRLSGPAAAERSREVYFVVAAAFSGGGHRHCVGHVPVFALSATPHTTCAMN